MSGFAIVGSKRVTATRIRYRSNAVDRGREGAGEDVRGGADDEGEMEIGVEGCSGAEAVVLRILGSRRRESCELDVDGDSGGASLACICWIDSCRRFVLWKMTTASPGEGLAMESTIGSRSLVGKGLSIGLILWLSSPLRTSL